MASNFPKLPGYVPSHDPTIVQHKKISHVKLEKNRNANNVEVPLYAVPRPPVPRFRPTKTAASMSLSQTQYVNHLGGNMDEQFEPTFVKLDKQVSRQTPLRWRCKLIKNAGAPLLWLFQRGSGREPS